MDNIAGKYVTRIIVGIVINMMWPLYAEHISLALFDATHKPLAQAAVGQPFLLEVTITDVPAHTTEIPEIVGAQQFNPRRVGFHMSSVNGASIVKYTFRMRADEKGTFVLGPARLVQSGSSQSETVTLVVGDAALVHGKKNASPRPVPVHSQDVIISLSSDKKEVVMGECVTCDVTLCCKEGVMVVAIGHDEMDGLLQRRTTAPVMDDYVVDGVVYKRARWQCDLYPQKEGRVTIPAFYVDYAVPDDRMAGMNRLMTSMLSVRTQQKRAYSNGVQLEVIPLPREAHNVDLVGSITHVHASITPGAAKQGDGMVLTLAVTGYGDVESLKEPVLKGFPDSFKYYSSKNHVTPPSVPGAPWQKSFEYIVQGFEPGEWEIPKQTLTYFDCQDHQVRCCDSSPLYVSILPDSALSKRVSSSQPIAPQPQPAAILPEHDHKKSTLYLPLNAQDPHKGAGRPYSMSWSMFIFLMFFPVIALRARELYGWFCGLKRFVPAWVVRRIVWYRLHRALLAAEQESDHARVYHIMQEAIAYRYAEQPQCALGDELYTRMGATIQEQVMLRLFFEQAQWYAFGAVPHNKVDHDTRFFQQAYECLCIVGRKQ